MTDKRKKQIETLEAATRSVLESEGFARWVRTRKAFHSYSLNNQILIAFQPPHVGDDQTAEFATQVAGFKAWQKLNRQVVKGAKGIRIFAPWTITEKDDDGKPVLDENGKPKKRVFFKLVSVFDISQTDGEPLAEFPTESIAGENHEAALEGLQALAASLEVEVTFEDLSERAVGGWYDEAAKKIVLDSSVSTDETVRVLTHELAHALGVGYREFGRDGAEVIVEAATTIALEAFGFDTSGASLPYIASWGEENGLEDLRRYLAKIDEVATALEGAVAPVAEAVAA